MAYKSIEHTITVHHEGVGVAINAYKTQAHARMNQILSADASIIVRSPSLSEAHETIHILKKTSDPYEFIRLNDEFTIYIDDNLNQFKFSEKDKQNFLKLHQNTKQESMVFHSHLITFNRLIERFPYRLIAHNYSVITFNQIPTIDGVIVER